MQERIKAVEFLGSTLDELRDFPLSARREAGYQIDKVQHGEEPDDWKPMKTIGSGVLNEQTTIQECVGRH